MLRYLVFAFLLLLSASAYAQTVVMICTQIAGTLAPSCQVVDATHPLPVVLK